MEILTSAVLQKEWDTCMHVCLSREHFSSSSFEQVRIPRKGSVLQHVFMRVTLKYN